MLNFNGGWRFNSPGKIPGEVVQGFFELVGRIASQSDRKPILEHFKRYFAGAAGTTAHISSNTSWAESDLHSYMQHGAENAPLFIEAFYDACADLKAARPEISIPDVGRMNRVLSENKAGYEIRPPDLMMTSGHPQIAVPKQAPSMDEQAQELIQQSLKESERLLAEGRVRPAVEWSGKSGEPARWFTRQPRRRRGFGIPGPNAV